MQVVDKTGIETDNACKDKQKRCIDTNLLVQRTRHLVFPHYIKVRFQAAESENERDEKTHGTDKSELTNRHVFCVLHDGDNRVDRPVEIQEREQVRQVVREKVTESDRDRNRGQKDQERYHSQERRIGKGCGAGKSMEVQEGLACNDGNLYGRDRTFGYIVEHPFPRKIFKPIWHQNGLLDGAGQAEGETYIAQFVFAIDAELNLGLADALDISDGPCPIVVGALRGAIKVVALVDVFPFNHEVAHDGAQDLAVRGKVETQVERLVIDARLEVLGFGSEIVVCAGIQVVILRVNAGIFTVGAEDREEFVAGVGGNTVSYVGRVLHDVNQVCTVGDLDFEREGELHVVFDTNIALVCGSVLGGNHGVQLVEATLPAEFDSVVAVIAHPETALGQILVDVGTEVGRLRPVGLPATDFQIHLVVFVKSPLVVYPVEVGQNLVVVGDLSVAVLDLVAEFRGKNTEHDRTVQVFALVLATDVGTNPAAAEVVVIVGDGLGGLGLYVTLEGHIVCEISGKCRNAHGKGGHCDFPELHVYSLEGFVFRVQI